MPDTLPTLNPEGDVLVEETTTDPILDGDHERMTHIVLEGFKAKRGPGFLPAGTSVVEGMVNGTAVRALCGKRWRPGRDPKKYPLCPTCAEIAKARGWKLPGH